MVASDKAYPLYLVIRPFRELAPSVRVLVRALDKVARYLPYAEGFYRNDGDEALIGMHFERDAIERLGVPALLDVVARCNLPVVVPEQLDPERSASFYNGHLPTYGIYVQQYRAPETESLLQRVIAVLKDHVDSLPVDEHYESVELSVDERTRPARASSEWEMELGDASDEPSRRHRASSKSDVRV